MPTAIDPHHGSPRIRRGWLVVTLGALAAVTVVAMAIDVRVADPPDPTMRPPDSYGHNVPGAFGRGASLVGFGLALLVAAFRPWRNDLGLAPFGLGLGAWLPWTILSLLWVIHSGGVMRIHAFWALAVLALLLVVAILEGGAVAWARLARRRASGRAP